MVTPVLINRLGLTFHFTVLFSFAILNLTFILLLLFHFQCALVHLIYSQSIFSKDRFLSQHFKHDQETKQYFRLGTTKQFITDKKINYPLRLNQLARNQIFNFAVH